MIHGPERSPVYAQELLSQDRITLIDIRVNRVISVISVISWKSGD